MKLEGLIICECEIETVQPIEGNIIHGDNKKSGTYSRKMDAEKLGVKSSWYFV